MRRFGRDIIAVIVLVLSAISAQAEKSETRREPRRVLVALLYPHIPDARAAYLSLEETFERAHSEIDPQIHLVSEEYDHLQLRVQIARATPITARGLSAPMRGIGRVLNDTLPRR
jgi:hypothetical protein